MSSVKNGFVAVSINRGHFIQFEVETCEKCGCDASVNARDVLMGGSLSGLHNLRTHDTLPAPIGWNEAFGGAICETCDMEEEEQEPITFDQRIGQGLME
jgi:hypothetical protein